MLGYTSLTANPLAFATSLLPVCANPTTWRLTTLPRWQTKAVDNTSDPEWPPEEKLELECGRGGAAAGGAGGASAMQPLHLLFKDSNIGFDADLGECTVPASDLNWDGAPHELTLPLQSTSGMSKKKRVATGTVTFTYRAAGEAVVAAAVPRRRASSRPSRKSVAGDGEAAADSADTAEAGAAATPEPAAPAEPEPAAESKPTPSASGVASGPRVLVVRVHQARGLLAKDSRPFAAPTSDPLAIVTVGRAKKMTEVIENSLSPVWDTTFTFPGATESDTVTLRLEDEDPMPGGNDFLGLTTMSVADGTTAGRSWHKLADKKGKFDRERGKVQVTVEWVSADASDAIGGAGGGGAAAAAGGSEGPAPNKIMVTLHRGRGLLAADGDTSDPVCRLQVKAGGKRVARVSRVIKKSLDPSWEQSFAWAATDVNAELTLLVEDDDRFGNDFLGMVNIKPYDFVGCSEAECRQWHRLRDKHGKADRARGELELTVQWVYDAAATDGQIEDGGGAEDGDSGEVLSDSEATGNGLEVKLRGPDARARAREAEQKLLAAKSAMKVEEGPYAVTVHIIEARDLKAEDDSRQSDPVVEIEVMGQKASTRVHHSVTSCIFDEQFVFEFPSLTKAELAAGTVVLKVLDADRITRGDVIGIHSLEVLDVYYGDKHEVYRKWMGLWDPTNSKDHGVQGFLRASVAVLGPNDPQPTHTTTDDADDDEELDENMLLLPPAVEAKTHFLVCRVHRAECLPAMDSPKLGIGKGGIDAFCKLTFAGNPPAKTRWVVARGARHLAVAWEEELWFPVRMPVMQARLLIEVFDYDLLVRNDRVGSVHLPFAGLAQSLEDARPQWVNIYGAPNGVEVGKNKNRMNRWPDEASNWRGRLLVSLADVDADDVDQPETVHKRKLRASQKSTALAAEVLPPMARYTIRAHVFQGCELPKVRAGLSLGGAKVGVSICIGEFEASTGTLSSDGGIANWNELLEVPGMLLPARVEELPDVFIYLYRPETRTAPRRNVAFARFRASEVMSHGGFGGEGKEGEAASARWVPLAEDKAVNAIDDDEEAGCILLRLALGSADEAASAPWRTERADLADKEPVQVRVHVYQGRDLPAADDNGSIDPFLNVVLGDQRKRTAKLRRTIAPQWYDTITFDAEIPRRRDLAPQLSLTLWDVDTFSGNDRVASVRLPLSHKMVQEVDASDDAALQPRNPAWWPLGPLGSATPRGIPVPIPAAAELDGDGRHKPNPYGDLLLLVQIVRLPEVGAELPQPPPIRPVTEEWFVELTVLGLRGMSPYGMLPVGNPCVEFDVGDRSHASGVVRTKNSKDPSGADANFCERLLLAVDLPLNPLFAPAVNVVVRDSRLGGFVQPTVATAAVPLSARVPWSAPYQRHVRALMGGAPDAAAAATAAGGAGAAPIAFPSSMSEAELDLAEKDTEEGRALRIAAARSSLPLPAPAASALKVADGSTLAEFAEDEKGRKFMAGRGVMDGELEALLPGTPFESLPLWRGQNTCETAAAGGGEASAGTLKVAMRLVHSRDVTPRIDLSAFVKPQTVAVRVYLLNAVELRSRDGGSDKSDPYMSLRLGHKVVSDRDAALTDVSTGAIRRCVEISTSLPGASRLEVNMMDYDKWTSDDLIGTTVIDLEDRWFDSRWQSLTSSSVATTGATTTAPGALVDASQRVVPVERRQLKIPTSVQSQGALDLWVDVMTATDAKLNPPHDIGLPPPYPVEIRAVIWRAKDVPSMETSGLNDLYAKVSLHGQPAQETDVHLRARGGRGSWNWRTKFSVTLPMEFPRLKLQLWDKDIIKYSDCIGEVEIPLGAAQKRALREKKPINVFQPKLDRELPSSEPEPVVEAGEDESVAIDVATGGGADETKATPVVAQAQRRKSWLRGGGGGGGAARGPVEVGSTAKTPFLEDFDEAGDYASTSVAPRRKDSLPADAEDLEAGGVPPVYDSEESSSDSDQDDDAAAAETLRHLREMVGMPERVNPPDARWYPLFYFKQGHDGRKKKSAGKVLISIEILPEDAAAALPAGLGRDAPNNYPVLPPPDGRIKMSINPFTMLNQILGPALCRKFSCCLICTAVVLLAVFGAPLVNSVISMFNLIPSPYGWVVVALICCLVIGGCGGCIWQYACRDDAEKQRERRERRQARKEAKARARNPLGVMQL